MRLEALKRLFELLILILYLIELLLSLGMKVVGQPLTLYFEFLLVRFQLFQINRLMEVTNLLQPLLLLLKLADLLLLVQLFFLFIQGRSALRR